MTHYTGRTSDKDLYHLSNQLGITNVIVCRKGELKKYLKNKMIKNYIINLDNYGGGSHWVAMNTSKKIYFDSYMQPKINEIPKDYKTSSQHKQLQSIESTDCGGLCCLWLYYINYKSNSEYIKLFKDCYPGI
jgi:hypothetical protein